MTGHQGAVQGATGHQGAVQGHQGAPGHQGADQGADQAGARNVWGTLRADIDASEFCPDCERATSPFTGEYRHYTNCPLYTEWSISNV